MRRNNFKILRGDKSTGACVGNGFRGLGRGIASGSVLELNPFPCSCPTTGQAFDVVSSRFAYDQDTDSLEMILGFSVNGDIIPYEITWEREFPGLDGFTG